MAKVILWAEWVEGKEESQREDSLFGLSRLKTPFMPTERRVDVPPAKRASRPTLRSFSLPKEKRKKWAVKIEEGEDKISILVFK